MLVCARLAVHPRHSHTGTGWAIADWLATGLIAGAGELMAEYIWVRLARAGRLPAWAVVTERWSMPPLAERKRRPRLIQLWFSHLRAQREERALRRPA